jgi:hypothetical protein
VSDKQSNLTDKEMEDLQSIVADTLSSVCAMADKHNIDRDSMLKYFADMLTAFTELASIQNYETNHTNADRIRNMSDEELADFLSNITSQCESNTSCNQYCFGCDEEYCDLERCLKWLQSETE